MRTHPSIAFRQARARRLAVATCIAGALLLAILWTGPALADGPDGCALCHQVETEQWQNSPHAAAASQIATASVQDCPEASSDDAPCMDCHATSADLAGPSSGEGVVCESCHGPYLDGHPDEQEMPIDADSSVCGDCHINIHADWEVSSHGKAGVQCISCHRSHTQNLRLDDQHLCAACHTDNVQDPGHEAHRQGGVACIDCHVSPAASSLQDGRTTHAHSFIVDTGACAGCHGDDFQTNPLVTNLNGDLPAGPASANAVTAPPVQSSLFSGLGLGLGIGGMLGIAFVLVVGQLRQREWRKFL